ncbi:hypothetical protein C7T36_05110 [Rhodococcus sp. AD45-ID]|uniref:hypothetical protein n=1 Tax=unclassified Rhodococcus (in: high G+C Gram-positive bacteria) TaxID=192944 RepID=UPI0005D390A1|nr:MULTISPECIES: hypothetical protein [unclassified Rhodococcus (in: high G+C Gram-positive bacteria)]KJF23157.1 hypothetical protein SZ00_00071 [Rhodococcus sp. AD45]PSR41657.1 hypothetical protein C7T36_05110 [Rhodococcus sp. AD45-ID]
MTEDSQQISVAELLKRNGQTVESRGGRRRRGVAGGISVAELTGEIPIVRPAGSRSAAESDAPTAQPETKPAETEIVETKTVETKPESTQAPVTEFTQSVENDDSDDTKIDLHKPISKSAPGQWVSRAPVEPKKAAPLAPTQAVPVVSTQAVPVVSTQAVPVVSQQAVPETTTRKPVPAGPPKVTQEPALLSGQTLAGDLMRQEREVSQNPSMRSPILPPRVAPSPADADVSTEMMASISDEPAENAGSTEPAAAAPEPSPASVEEVAPAEPATAEDTGDRNSIREWAILAGQVVVALIIGGAMFKGFEKLWDMLPWVALVLALIVIVGLVAVVRVLRKTDDITSFVIAVVVGMIVTLGPLAFLLTSG